MIRSPDALRRIFAPGELGFARAYVAGDLDIEGDIYAALALRERIADAKLRARHLARRAAAVGVLPPTAAPPPEEARLHGRRHPGARRRRDPHHYDVSNDFYRLVLGPSMTYSCAVWSDDTHARAGAGNKYELICRKLALDPGMRLLDVGCGGAGWCCTRPRHHGRGPWASPSRAPGRAGPKRVADAGLADRVEIRLQDYRDVDDGPYDAISSIGMFEHVGLERLDEYFAVPGCCGPEAGC